MKRVFKCVSAIAGVLLLSVITSAAAPAMAEKCDVGPVFEFTRGAAEGLAVAPNGDIVVGNINTGEIWLAPRGDFARATLFADLIDEEHPFRFVLGMDITPDGTLFVAVNAFFDPALHGLWRIDRSGTATLAAPFPPLFQSLLNDVAIDRRGNVYVSDSLGGAVWKMTPEGELAMWSDGAIWEGGEHPIFGIPFGVNGLTYHQGALYGGIYLEGRIVRVPIAHDGTAGTPEDLVVDAALIGADGLEVDASGDLYVAVNDADTLVRIDSKDLTIETLIWGLSAPASIVVTPNRQTVYIANLSISAPAPRPYEAAVMAATLCQSRP
ncbi:MAG TPA: hypothetical protein VJ691_07780 [Vicinamibacterales bacterium]|nr:hypothetical protein [Vicinamibacterales bacterium]